MIENISEILIVSLCLLQKEKKRKENKHVVTRHSTMPTIQSIKSTEGVDRVKYK